MRKGLVIVGVILLIVGVIAAGFTYQQTTDLQIPQSPNASVATLGSVTAGTITVNWNSGSSNTVVKACQCADPSCGSLGSVVGSGTGGSGSFSFSASSGATYAFASNSAGVSGSVVIDGFVPLTFIGIALAGVGAFLLVVGAMARPRHRPAPTPMMEPTPAAGPMGSSRAPLMGTPTSGSEEEMVMPPMAAEPSPAAGSSNPAQMIKCASCGTLNEIWLHNCRWCKRPLTTTG